VMVGEGKAECPERIGYISLDFLAQKVYRFLVVGYSAFRETTGAIWMKEEDLPR